LAWRISIAPGLEFLTIAKDLGSGVVIDVHAYPSEITLQNVK